MDTLILHKCIHSVTYIIYANETYGNKCNRHAENMHIPEGLLETIDPDRAISSKGCAKGLLKVAQASTVPLASGIV